jgi:hypothetical protein
VHDHLKAFFHRDSFIIYSAYYNHHIEKLKHFLNSFTVARESGAYKAADKKKPLACKLNLPYIKGTVQRKLTWVKSGINRKLMIWACAAWGLFFILRGLGPYNLNKSFRRLNDFSCGLIRKCGVRCKIAL